MVATNNTAKKTVKSTRVKMSAEKIAQSTEQKLVQLLGPCKSSRTPACHTLA